MIINRYRLLRNQWNSNNNKMLKINKVYKKQNNKIKDNIKIMLLILNKYKIMIMYNKM